MSAQGSWSLVFLAAMALPWATPATAQKPQAWAMGAEGMDETGVIYRVTAKSTADLGPGTRVIRILVHYSRSKFYVASGQPRGFEHDLLKEFEAFHNKDRKKREARIPVVFIPVQFDELIPMLVAGRGDI